MFIFFLIFLVFYGLYYYFTYQLFLLNDLNQIFSQTAERAQEYSDQVLEDLGNCYVKVSTIILAATLITFLWILLLKYNAKLIVWISVFTLPIVLSVGCYYSLATYISLLGQESDLDNIIANEQTLAFDKALQTILTAELMSYVRNETLWLTISIILLLILVGLSIILYSLRKRVKLSIELIVQASKAINGVKSTLFFPVIPRTFGVLALSYGILISLLIISASHPTFRTDDGLPCSPKMYKNPVIPPAARNTTAISKCNKIQPLSRQHTLKYHAVNIFATLWLINFISGISRTTLAGAFASYYWAYRRPPFFAVTSSLYRVLVNHLGDIAFGSLLIATIRYFRIVIEFVGNRIRKKQSSEINNPTCFLRIFFWLLDKFLRYIDRNAYIMMSMYGEGYLASAKRAVELLYKNTTRALVLDYVTYFVLLVSRVLITGTAGYVASQTTFATHYKWLPTALVVVGTYFIAKGLFSVYSMAVDTLFICFLIDSSTNDGSAERPFFMSKELRKVMKRTTVYN